MNEFNPENLKRKALKRHNSSCQTLGNFLNVPQTQVYNMLENYLIDKGCPIAAKYFKKLALQEDHIIKTEFVIRKRIRDNHCLLTTIVENIQIAEEAFRVGDGKSTLEYLVETVCIIQDLNKDFNWLVKEAYKIILRIFDDYFCECPLMLCRSNFEYGLLLAEKDVSLEEAISFMDKSIVLCKKSESVTISDEKRDSFLREVSSKLYEIRLRAAFINSWVSLRKSAMFAGEAAETIVKTQGFSNMYCTAKLLQSAYNIDNQDYDDALKILSDIEKHILNDSPGNKCAFYHIVGLCYFNIFPQNVSLAKEKFKLSLEISHSYNYVYFKAETLLHLAKVYSYHTTTYARALRCLTEAKDIYHKLRYFEREEIVNRFIAQLKANRVFPNNYLDPIKNAVTDSFCYLIGLIKWKKSKLPFWIQDEELRRHEEEIQRMNSGNENVINGDE